MADNFGFKPSLINPTAPSSPYPPPSPSPYPPSSASTPYPPSHASAPYPPSSAALPVYQPPPVSSYPPPTYSPGTYPSSPQYPSRIYRPPPLNSYPTPPPPPSYPPPSVCPPSYSPPSVCPPSYPPPSICPPSFCPPSPSPSQWGSTLIAAGHKAYYWVDWTAHRMVPPTAVHGGVDKDGSQIYVGRAYHEGDWIPAKVIPEKHIAYVAYGGGEHGKNTFQVLCEQRFDWIPAHGGEIPAGAVEGGRTSSGEVLYIGRVWHDGAHTVGKVQSSHGCCYIPYDMREMSFPTYEILVLRV